MAPVEGVFQFDKATFVAGKLFGHEKWLRQEPLNTAGPIHDAAVFLGEFFQTQHGDDVLQFFVLGQRLANLLGNLVMPPTNDVWHQQLRPRLQGIDGRI